MFNSFTRLLLSAVCIDSMHEKSVEFCVFFCIRFVVADTFES